MKQYQVRGFYKDYAQHFYNTDNIDEAIKIATDLLRDDDMRVYLLEMNEATETARKLLYRDTKGEYHFPDEEVYQKFIEGESE